MANFWDNPDWKLCHLVWSEGLYFESISLNQGYQKDIYGLQKSQYMLWRPGLYYYLYGCDNTIFLHPASYAPNCDHHLLNKGDGAIRSEKLNWTICKRFLNVTTAEYRECDNRSDLVIPIHLNLHRACRITSTTRLFLVKPSQRKTIHCNPHLLLPYKSVTTKPSLRRPIKKNWDRHMLVAYAVGIEKVKNWEICVCNKKI